MADEIKISVELKETGPQSVKEHIASLKQANKSVEDVKKAYANLGNVASKELRRMSQITDGVYAGLKSALDEIQKKKDFSQLTNLVNTFKQLGTEIISVSDKYTTLNKTTQQTGTYTKAMVTLAKQVAAEYNNLGLTLAGNVVSAFKQTAYEAQRVTTSTKAMSGLISQVAGEYNNLGITLANNVVGAFKKTAYEAFKTTAAIKGMSDTSGIYQLSNGMRTFADATKIVGSDLTKMNAATKQTQAYTGSLNSTIAKARQEHILLGNVVAGDVVGAYLKGTAGAKKYKDGLNNTTVATQKLKNATRETTTVLSAVWAGLKVWGGNRLREIGHNMGAMSRSALDLASDFQGYRNALAVAADATQSISARIASANTQLNDAVGIAQKYKLSIVAVTKSYSKFVNALSLANVPLEQASKHFENFATFARVANLSAQNTQGMFLALEQMASKGVVSMEELRRQLGEHLPGAVNIAAQAVGMSTSAFIKKVSSGQQDAIELITKLGDVLVKRVTPLVASSLQKYSANVEQLKNEWIKLKVVLGDVAVSVINPILESFTSLIAGINSFVQGLVGTESLIKSTGEAAHVVSSDFSQLAGNMQSISDNTTQFATTLGELKNSISGVGKELLNGVAVLGITATSSAALIKTLSLLKQGVLWLFAPLTGILKLFGSFSVKMTATLVTGKLFQRMLLNIGMGLGYIIKYAKAGGVLAFLSGLYVLIQKRWDISEELENNSIALRSLGVSADLANREILILNQQLKQATNPLEAYGLLYVQLGAQLELAKDNVRQYKATLEALSATSAETNPNIALLNDRIAEAEAVVRRLTPAYELARQALTGFKEEVAKDPGVDPTIAGMIHELGLMATKIKEGDSVYTTYLNKLREFGNVNAEGASDVLKLAKMVDELKAKAKDSGKGIDELTKSIQKMSETISNAVAEENKSLATMGMLSSEVEMYDAGLEYTNRILEINKLALQAKNEAQLLELEALRASTQELYKNQVVRLADAKTKEKEKKDLEALTKETEKQIATLQVMAEYTHALQAAQNKRASPLQQLRAEENAAKRQIVMLEEQIALLSKLPGKELDIIRIKSQILALTQELDLVGDKFKDVFEDSFTSFFDDILNQTKSFGDALTDLFTDITREINSIMSKELANSLTNSLFGKSAGLGGAAGSNGFTQSLLSGLFGNTSASSQVAALAPYGGGPPAAMAGSGGGFFDSLLSGIGGIFGFANGGDFRVGGSGGTDSQLVAFKASPNEHVAIRTPEQMKNEGSNGVVVNNYITVEAPNGNVSRESLHQIQVAAGRSINTQLRRNG